MRKLAILLTTAVLLAPGQAVRAQIIPVADQRVVMARATGFAQTVIDERFPVAPFAYFEEYPDAFIENPDPNGGGSCDATAFQISQILANAISASGGTGGSWNVHPATTGGSSRARFRIRFDSCQQYQLDAWVDPGDFVGSAVFNFGVPGASSLYQSLLNGEVHVTGKLAPGEYIINGDSGFTTGLESFTSGTYSYILIAFPAANPIIDDQPDDVSLACGGTATFSVTTIPPASGLTFQWRRNQVPLANGGNVSGANTPTLMIASACDADSGWYDVVVSGEPSRAAHLWILGNSGVDDAPLPAPPQELALSLAGENPARGSAAFRYVVASPRRVQLALHDVTGARVRTLADRVLEGSGVVTWDGRTDAGTRAKPGLYFLRAVGGTAAASRAVVLVE